MVSAVNGYAYGGEARARLLTGHCRVAGENAPSRHQIKVGMFPGDGGTQRLPRSVGAHSHADDLSGEPIDARTALAWGLVSEVFATTETVSRAVALAALVARHSPLAARMPGKK